MSLTKEQRKVLREMRRNGVPPKVIRETKREMRRMNRKLGL